jgi:3-hydroxybutyryl-CoA dehydrogenase
MSDKVVSPVDIKNIAIVGAGFIGPGIAQVFAARGFSVCLIDIKEDILAAAINSIRFNLAMMAERGLGSAGDIENIMSRIKTSKSINDGVPGSRMVIEAVTEKMDLKQSIFQQLDKLCSPDVILASNTSVMSITEIASISTGRDRIVGTHFWNPPFLIPLVEVTKARDTSDTVMETTYQVLKLAGKHPVKCMKDVPGFIANRLQHALWREAISIVQSGIADAATVDEAVKNSFAIRLPVLGPLENADMVGLDLTLSIHDYILKYLESSPAPSPLLKEKVNQGNLGFKSGEGFQKWTPEEIKKSRDGLLEYLIEWTKSQQK